MTKRPHAVTISAWIWVFLWAAYLVTADSWGGVLAAVLMLSLAFA